MSPLLAQHLTAYPLSPACAVDRMEAELEKKRLKKIAEEERSRQRTQIVADVEPEDEDGLQPSSSQLPPQRAYSSQSLLQRPHAQSASRPSVSGVVGSHDEGLVAQSRNILGRSLGNPQMGAAGIQQKEQGGAGQRQSNPNLGHVAAIDDSLGNVETGRGSKGTGERAGPKPCVALGGSSGGQTSHASVPAMAEVRVSKRAQPTRSSCRRDQVVR
jgi:hypothetical protein